MMNITAVAAAAGSAALSSGEIVGIVVAGVAVLSAIGAIGVCCSRKTSTMKIIESKDGTKTTEITNEQQGDAEAEKAITEQGFGVLKNVASMVFHSTSSTITAASAIPLANLNKSSASTSIGAGTLDEQIFAAVSKDPTLASEAAQLLEYEANVRETQAKADTAKAKFFLNVASHSSSSAPASPASLSATIKTVVTTAESHIIEVQHLGNVNDATPQ